MITVEQAQVLRIVYQRIVEEDSTSREWDEFDETMIALEYLSDYQLIIEVQVKLAEHLNKNARCTMDHPSSECFVSFVLEAATYVVNDYIENNRLVKSTRYMLQYYLAMAATEAIITD